MNLVDSISRKGYRFRGSAEILREGPHYERAANLLRNSGVSAAFGAIVLVKVEAVSAVVSPVYDSGVSEDDVRATWLARRRSSDS